MVRREKERERENYFFHRSVTKHDSSGEERNLSDDDPSADTPPVAMVKQPVRELTEHRAPVMACDWLADGHQLVTASWDHTAKLWDIESGQIIHSLEGVHTVEPLLGKPLYKGHTETEVSSLLY